MRVLFIGGNGHHYLRTSVEAGLAEAVGCATDGRDDATVADRLPGDVPTGDDYRAMIDDLKPDAVSIGGWYAHNGDIVAEALERGVKVVSDKPVVATWQQYERVEALCRDGDRVLLTEFNLRCDPAFRAAARAIAEGRIGEPVMWVARKSYRFGKQRPDFYRRRSDYGGTLLWVASHGIDAIWYAGGVPFATVAGHQGNVSRPDYDEMEDHVAVCFAMGNGGTAVCHADYLRPAAAPTHGDDQLRVVGATGQVEVVDRRCTLITQDEAPADITDAGGDASIGRDMVAALNGEMSHFSTEQSLYLARVLLASRDAVDQGRVRAIA